MSDSSISSKASDSLAISVIIPLYNAEKYIGECLDSILAQTFKNFELILVDDCSTDNSVKIVESYAPKFARKFAGSLRIYYTGKNSGSGAIARNIGLSHAKGEYVFNMDNDDIITETALEEMYTLAKKYVADVVYCEKYYMSKGVGEEFRKNIYLADSRIQKAPFVDKPTLESEDLAVRIKKILDRKFWVAPWLKLIRRDLLVKYKILFPILKISDDDIWTFELIFVAKKFLRVPNMIYIRRMRDDSLSLSKRTSQQTIHFWLNPILLGLKELDKFMNQLDFFKVNPQYRYDVLKYFFEGKLINCFNNSNQLSPFEVYETIRNEFGKYFDDYGSLVFALCTYILEQRKDISAKKNQLNQAKTSEEGLKKFIDEKDKQIRQLNSRINSLLTQPDTLQTLPAISVIIPMYNVEKYVAECLDSLLNQTFQNFEVILVDDCSEDNSVAIVEDYKEKFQGRLQVIKLKEKSIGGGGSLPRQMGLEISIGEYIFFLDADDVITDTAFEELYNIAQEYEADVVHCEKFYMVPDKIWHNKGERDKLKADNHFTTGRLDVTSPTLLSEDISKRIEMFAEKKLIWNFWAQLVRRDFIIKNEITLPDAVAQDMLFTMCSLCCAKNYVVVPNVVNYYRVRENSVTQEKINAAERIHKWLNVLRVDIEYINNFFSKHKELSNKIALKYMLFDTLMNQMITGFNWIYVNKSSALIVELLEKEFGARDDTAFLSYIFHKMNSYRIELAQNKKLLPESKSGSGKKLISVIIPLYNAEKHIGELLESLLEQTLQNFEVIVVDDCSTDKSFEVVKDYEPKFKGQLSLTKTSKNSGGLAEPGNLGVALSRGDYLFIVDSDITVAPDALDKLYKVAKDFDADVVTCEKFYRIPEASWYDTKFRRQLKPNSSQEGGFVNKPTLIPFDVAQRVQAVHDRRFSWSLWQKLIRRDFWVKNKIGLINSFAQDFLITSYLAYTAERFVRVPYVVTNWRVSDDSKYSQGNSSNQMETYLKESKIGFDYLEAFLSDREYFQQNPATKSLALDSYFKEAWNMHLKKVYDKIPVHAREEIFSKEFADTNKNSLGLFLFYMLKYSK